MKSIFHHIPHNRNGHEIHRAKYLLIHPDRILENGFLRIIGGRIVEVGHVRDLYLPDLANATVGQAKVFDHGDGVILPPLVNAHTHFELSALHGRIPFHGGFNAWVKSLLVEREQSGESLLREKAAQAMASCFATGTGLVGEISTLGITSDLLIDSDLSGICFQEYLGTDRPLPLPLERLRLNECPEMVMSASEMPYPFSSPPSMAMRLEGEASGQAGKDLSLDGRRVAENDAGLHLSVAGHAPHTTSPDLLRYLKQQTRRNYLPFSIHVAESTDETEFITTHQGPWASFLAERGIDTSDWSLPSRSPIQHLHDLGILDEGTLAVHLIDLDDADLDIIAKTGVVPVICPRSNMNLHGRLPNLTQLLKRLGDAAGKSGLPALGTDSLASTGSLNLFDEMAFIAAAFPEIRPSEILTMATLNGARALGFDGLTGTLDVGKKSDFLYLPLTRHHDLTSSSIKYQELILDIITYYEKTTNGKN